ncbi:MAG: 50S ribosomal protein L18Ae [Fervidicoccaceae archaeon]
MKRDVKVYKIVGKMLLSHDRNPEWRNFTIEIRAIDAKHALEKVYSELGSRHKLKRYHVRIENVEELPPEAASSRLVREFEKLTALPLKRA